jgi:hypothetical protein
MSFVSRVRAYARPGPMDRAGPSAATTEDYVSGTPGDAVPDPAPGRPVPTPDPKVTFGASPVKGGAAKAADGRHPWGRPLVPARLRNRIRDGRRGEFSPPHSVAGLRCPLFLRRAFGCNALQALQLDGNAKYFNWVRQRFEGRSAPTPISLRSGETLAGNAEEDPTTLLAFTVPPLFLPVKGVSPTRSPRPQSQWQCHGLLGHTCHSETNTQLLYFTKAMVPQMASSSILLDCLPDLDSTVKSRKGVNQCAWSAADLVGGTRTRVRPCEQSTLRFTAGRQFGWLTTCQRLVRRRDR